MVSGLDCDTVASEIEIQSSYNVLLRTNIFESFILLYNCGMIFSYVLSFFVGYILVKLRTIRLSARAGAHIECRCSHSRAEDVTITNPRWEMELGCEWRHARKRRAGNFGDFWKKQLVEIRTWTKWVEIWSWARPVQFVVYGMRRAFVGSDGTVSIVKIVSLSPRAERLNSRSQ